LLLGASSIDIVLLSLNFIYYTYISLYSTYGIKQVLTFYIIQNVVDFLSISKIYKVRSSSPWKG
jgi:hypothetical protein